MSKRSRKSSLAAVAAEFGAPRRLTWSLAAHYAWRWRRQLAPLYVGAAVPASVAAAHIWMSAAPDTWTPGAWLAGAAAVGAGMTGLAVSQMRDDRAVVGIGAGLAWGYATALTAWPEAGQIWGAWALSIPVVGSAWWWGTTMRSLSRAARDDARGHQIIHDLGIDARLASATRTGGCVEWGYDLGTGTRATQIHVADVAHVLGVETGRVHVLPGDTTRTVVIRLLNAAPTSKPVAHPALTDHDPGGLWEPATRTIMDPIPIGTRPDGSTSVVELMPDGDVGHVLVVGKTGAGKSVTMASIATGVVACRDAVFAAADIPKRGVTFRAFAQAMPRVAETGEELLADLQRLLELAGHRNSSLADAGLDKHQPSADDPTIVYAIEELPATLEALSLTDAMLAEEISQALDALSKVARSAGILLILLAQRPDFTALPTSIRAQITTLIVHALRQKRDLMGLWRGADVDPARDLPVKGMAYVATGGDGDPEPQRAWWQTQADKKTVAGIYAATRPALTSRDQRLLGWIDDRDTARDTASVEAAPSTPVDTPMPPVAEVAAEVAAVVPGPVAVERRTLAQRTADRRAALESLRALAAEVDALELPDIPTGAAMPCEPLVTREADTDTDAALLTALAEADAGLATRELTESVGAPRRTVQARIAALAEAQRVHCSGQGRGVRWHLTRDPALTRSI